MMRFDVNDVIIADGERYQVLGTPDVFKIAPNNTPAYAIQKMDGNRHNHPILIVSQAEVESDRFHK